METLLTSTLAIFLAEIGDKTQLLTLLLIGRFRAPLPILAGMLVATLLNHGLAGSLGVWLFEQLALWLSPSWRDGLVTAGLLAMALWLLVPDTLEEDSQSLGGSRAFWVTLGAFFLAEMGDKTQVATLVLAADAVQWGWVLVGSTLGLMLANLPVVLAGPGLLARLPLRALRLASALLFSAMALWPWLSPSS
ncbi:TMEM165/GDT1 family protein [Gallaecimonas sp. GXIMD4217]|uniref:TMEM165/GDT1 family protein n=1 Tax=Gallaecimonas sp. GXIMD4217 TaxID=3131927 RepID=UPI00311AC693